MGARRCLQICAWERGVRSGKRRVRARLQADFSRTKTHRPRVIVPPSAPQPAIQPLQRLARVSASTARRIHISVRCGGRTLSTVTGEFWSRQRFRSRPMHTSRRPSTKTAPRGTFLSGGIKIFGGPAMVLGIPSVTRTRRVSPVGTHCGAARGVRLSESECVMSTRSSSSLVELPKGYTLVDADG